MAEGPDVDDVESEERNKIKKSRRLQELFKGRFTPQESGILLRHNNWDVILAADYILKSEPEVVTELLKEVNSGDWEEVKKRRQRREEILRDNSVRQTARENRIGHEFRQFGCDRCDNMWWRKVTARKLVSRCKKCSRNYDAIPRDLEWGWARFACVCGNEFHGFGAMGKTWCPCYRNMCYKPCSPEEVLPPLKGKRKRGNRRTRHSCRAPNCFNRSPPGPNEPAINLCVHPRSLRKQVVEASEQHKSTGSTVKTFFTQNELENPFDLYEPSLADVSEIIGHSDDDNQ